MSVQYENLRSAVRQVALDRSVSDGGAAMFIMAVGVMAMAKRIPDSLRAAAIQAAARWFAGLESSGSLEPARVECWRFLEAKNGNSTTVADRTDIAVRGLICVLWDQPYEGDGLETTLEFFAQLADRFGGLEDALEVVE